MRQQVERRSLKEEGGGRRLMSKWQQQEIEDFDNLDIVRKFAKKHRGSEDVAFEKKSNITSIMRGAPHRTKTSLNCIKLDVIGERSL